MPMAMFSASRIVLTVTLLAAHLLAQAQSLPLEHEGSDYDSCNRVSLVPDQSLSLKQVEHLALANEQGVFALQAQAQALSNEAIASAQLPDPHLQINAANLPTDTFSFSQEAMTQLQFSVSQMLPAKGILQAKQGIRDRQAQSFMQRAKERQLYVLRTVRKDWLELYYWQQARQVTQQGQVVFRQLLEVVTSLYSVGKKNQYDLLKAELELSKLSNQLVSVDDQIARLRSQLARWLGVPALTLSAEQTPNWKMANDSAKALTSHPTILALNEQVNAQQFNIDLAEAGFGADWKVNVGYGYRDQDASGRNLADFFSAGISVQMPLFPEKRQDKTYRASVQRHQSAISAQQVKLMDMQADLHIRLSESRYLQQRIALYQSTILIQAQLQAEASLKAYQSDRADFSDVTDSVLAELALRLESVRLEVDYLQQLAEIKYLRHYNEIEELTL